MTENNNISYRFLPAQTIKPRDDTFHGSKYLLDIEWWYFDAVFDNGLSAHIGFRAYHIRGIGILQTRINLYKNGVLFKEKINRSFLPHITIDKKKPTLKIGEKTILSFHNDSKKANIPWTYSINLSIEEVTLQLTFTGETEGWKIETDSTCWTVPLPSASVNGKIEINEKSTTVSGKGYHDHNWGYSPTTVIQNLGWYWGRISADSLQTTWANTLASKTNQDLITVVNKPFDETSKKPVFTSIHPNHIKFEPKNQKQKGNFILPHTFDLIFNQPENNHNPSVSGKLTMNTIDIHYDRIFIIHYWRYHVETTGYITYGDITERLDKKPQIIEYLRFKAP
jgi:predicted secreted hydrolase